MGIQVSRAPASPKGGRRALQERRQLVSQRLLVSRVVGALLVVATGGLFDCASLESIPSGTCGNGVVDSATEDCDTFPAACGRPTDGVRACRFTCTRGAADACPTGWGCSVDGFCRQATGTFEEAGGPISAGIISLEAGDFDGDGRTDLVGGGALGSGSKARVHFFGDGAQVATTVTLAFPPSTPVVRDFDRDGRDDIGFTANGVSVGAFGLVAGRADRTFVPVLFPTLSLAESSASFAVVTAGKTSSLPSAVGAAVVALQANATGTRLVSLSADVVVGATSLSVPASIAPSELVGGLQAGRIFPPGAVSRCGEVVGAYNREGKGHVAVFSPCVTAGPNVVWNNGAPIDDTTLSIGTVQQLRLVDLNEDGLVEVVLQTSSGYFFARAAGAGLGLSAFEPLTLGALPVAVIDFNGDAARDVVTFQGIAIAEQAGDAGATPGATEGTVVARPAGGLWSDVKVGQLNGDAFVDVVATTPNALDIEVFGNTGDGRFTRFVVGSEQPVRAMTIGDFDGDRIQDVAFLQSPRALDDPAGSGTAQLMVAYGKANGGPETPRLIGSFERATGLAAFPQLESGVDDLLVYERKANGAYADHSLTVVLGNGDRASIAPLFFRDDQSLRPLDPPANARRPEKLRIWTPVALASGPLLEVGGVDVAAFAYGVTVNLEKNTLERIVPTGFWLAKHDGQATGGLDFFAETFKLDPLLAGLDVAKLETGVLEIALVSASTDVDNPPNGVDEIVTLTRAVGGQSSIFVVRPAQIATAPPLAIPVPGIAVSDRDQLVLRDLTGDGLPDIVHLARTPGQEKLRVHVNDGRAGFDPNAIELVLPNEAALGAPTGFAPVITGVESDGKPRVDLAVASAKGLAFAMLPRGARVFTVRDATSLLGAGHNGSLTSMSAGDFDGDGVADLAIADSGAIRILRQRARLP